MSNASYHFLKIEFEKPLRNPTVAYLEKTPYEVHRFAYQLHHPSPNKGQDRLLYRLESSMYQMPFLMVQTNFAPYETGIEKIREHEGVVNVSHKQVKPQFDEGQVYRFRLRANPTRQMTQRDEAGERKKSKLEAVVLSEELEAWMERQGHSHGFSLALQNMRKEGVVSIKKPFERDRQSGEAPIDFFEAVGSLDQAEPSRASKKHFRTILLNSVVFEGSLRVEDSANFQKAFEQGIGRGKSFGFGMLSLARR